MSRHTLLRFAMYAVFALVPMGCGSAPVKSTSAPSASTPHSALDYYPLRENMHWSFMLRDPRGGLGLLAVTKVLAFDGTTAVLATGEETKTLVVDKDGIRREPSHAYVLRFPFHLGLEWPLPQGGVARISKVHVPMAVEAGSFDDCVTVTESFSGDESRTVETTFCAQVGPVRVEVHARGAGLGEEPQVAIATLRSFGTPQDVAAPAPSASAH